MNQNKVLESGKQKILNASKQASDSGKHEVNVNLTGQEHKEVLQRFYADLVKPDHISKAD